MPHDRDDASMDVQAILQQARELGFEGFGGLCGEAAVAINRILLDGKGTLVGALNAAFLDHDRLIGHVAVRHGETLWDADARPKDEQDIESWGMLDLDDPDYREVAAEIGLLWDDDAAEKVDFVEFESDEEVLERFGSDNLDGMCAVLERARSIVVDGHDPGPGGPTV